MVYEELRGATKDIDFIASRRDFVTLSGIVAEIERVRDIRIDVFPDGQLTGYSYPTYARHAIKLQIGHDHLDVFRVDDIGFIVMKVLASREHDLADIETIINHRGLPSQQDIEGRISELQFDKECEALFRSKLDRFFMAHYL